MAMPESANGLLLKGLNGNNPLAFLAALGVLRTVVLATPERVWRMRWTANGSGWSPLLYAKKIHRTQMD